MRAHAKKTTPKAKPETSIKTSIKVGALPDTNKPDCKNSLMQAVSVPAVIENAEPSNAVLLLKNLSANL